MSAVILLDDHQRILRKTKRACFRFNVLMTALILTLALCLSPFTSNESLTDPQSQILQALKSKPLTISQGLDISQIIIEQSRVSGVPVPLILAVIDTESEFKSWATSQTNARGLMQLSPEVWQIYMGETALKDHRNAYDPSLNVRVGIQFLGDLLQIYKGDLPSVLRCYFTGKNIKTRATEKYISAVLSRMERYNRG